MSFLEPGHKVGRVWDEPVPDEQGNFTFTVRFVVDHRWWEYGAETPGQLIDFQLFSAMVEARDKMSAAMLGLREKANEVQRQR